MAEKKKVEVKEEKKKEDELLKYFVVEAEDDVRNKAQVHRAHMNACHQFMKDGFVPIGGINVVNYNSKNSPFPDKICYSQAFIRS